MIDQKVVELLQRFDTLLRMLSSRAAVIEQIAASLLGELAVREPAAAARIAAQVEHLVQQREQQAEGVPLPQVDAALLELLNVVRAASKPQPGPATDD